MVLGAYGHELTSNMTSQKGASLVSIDNHQIKGFGAGSAQTFQAFLIATDQSGNGLLVAWGPYKWPKIKSYWGYFTLLIGILNPLLTGSGRPL